MQPAKIFIVDDHPLVRTGLRQLIDREPDLEVCCEAGTMQEAIQLISDTSPDIAIIDVSLPDGNGLELVKRLRTWHPDTQILVLSMHDETLFAERALRTGAMGYINKEEAADKVIGAIREILKGKIWVSGHMTERLLRDVARHAPQLSCSPIDYLSNRELEVFELIGRGLGTGEIADNLHLSIKTIETHRANIKRKLNLDSSGELSRRAMQWSLEEQ